MVKEKITVYSKNTTSRIRISKSISPYELAKESRGFREWSIPARLVNKYFKDKTIYSIDDEAIYVKTKTKIKFEELKRRLRHEKILQLLKRK